MVMSLRIKRWPNFKKKTCFQWFSQSGRASKTRGDRLWFWSVGREFCDSSGSRRHSPPRLLDALEECASFRRAGRAGAPCNKVILFRFPFPPGATRRLFGRSCYTWGNFMPCGLKHALRQGRRTGGRLLPSPDFKPVTFRANAPAGPRWSIS